MMSQVSRVTAIACGGLLLATVALAGVPATQTEATIITIKRVPVSTEQVWLLRAGSGGAIYVDMCSSCHGVDGTGEAAAMAALEAPVPNLTVVRRLENPKEFDRDHVNRVLRSDCGLRFHKTTAGKQTMPCWRQILAHSMESDAHGVVVTSKLIDHIAALQQ